MSQQDLLHDQLLHDSIKYPPIFGVKLKDALHVLVPLEFFDGDGNGHD
mgnify:FL=1